MAALLHSSGTTGVPKGIPLKHGHILAGVRNAAAAGYFDEGEIHMAYLPIAWVGDFIFSVGAAIALRFVVHIPESQETAQHDLRKLRPRYILFAAHLVQHAYPHTGWHRRIHTRKKWLYNKFMPFAIELERRRLEGHNPTAFQRAAAHLNGLLRAGKTTWVWPGGAPATAGEAIGEMSFVLPCLGPACAGFMAKPKTAPLPRRRRRIIKLHTWAVRFQALRSAWMTTAKSDAGRQRFDGYYQQPPPHRRPCAMAGCTGDAGYFEDVASWWYWGGCRGGLPNKVSAIPPTLKTGCSFTHTTPAYWAKTATYLPPSVLTSGSGALGWENGGVFLVRRAVTAAPRDRAYQRPHRTHQSGIA